MTPTQTLPATPQGLALAAHLLRAGLQVAMPTETVYGLAADARNDRAVAGIFAAKDRPSFNPLIVHVSDIAAARKIAVMPPEAEALAAQFWPGPLTLVLPIQPDAGLSALVTAGLDSVAVRVPAHPVAQALLAQFGGPLAAPSANPSGQISPTRSEHVLAGLSGRIAAVIAAGPCTVGVESTIVDMTGPARLLRPGGIALEALEACLGHALLTAMPFDDAAPARPTAPGQLASHYAPGAAVRLEAQARQGAGDIWLGFGTECAGADLNLSPTGDLVEAAANLFDMLHQADALAQRTHTGTLGQIVVAPIPEIGLGRAINDRLRRAAAPRG